MVSITKKVLGLAGVATAFAGMAFGQAATCAAPAATTTIIRAEGTAEAVAPVTFVCTTVAGNAAGTGSLQVFLNPALPVTSRVTTAPATEARLSVTPTGGATTTVAGSISGSTISFSGITLAPLTAGQTYTFVIDSVRVNATSLSVGTGIPPAISMTPFITGSTGTLVPAALASTQVAFVQNGLGATAIRPGFTTTVAGFPNGTVGTTAGSNSFVICATTRPSGSTVVPVAPATTVALGSAAGLAFTLQVTENFTGAFKTAAQESTPSVAALVNGTRLTVNFANVPAGVGLWVPNAPMASIAAGSPATLQLANTAIGTALAAPTGGATSGNAFLTGTTAANGLVAVPLTSGAGSATFEVAGDGSNALDAFNIPVFIVSTANGTTASTSGITASVSFAPVGATTVPNFVVGSSTNTVTGSTFNTCTTSLLFPFVTNQLGFDTGLAISNTSTDPFGTRGATAQAGTCALNFYGSGAPSPANVTTPNVPTGTTYTQVLSGVAAGFQGYVIAQCNFQYAHGFAFITNGVGTNGGLSQGYLAGVIPDVNQVVRATVTGETLGN